MADSDYQDETEKNDIYVDVINTFIIYYNNKYNKNENLISNCNYNNPVDTTPMMEEMQYYLDQYKLGIDNEKLVYIYHPHIPENDIQKQNYVLEVDNNKVYSSYLLLPLLLCVVDKYIGTKWNIIEN